MLRTARRGARISNGCVTNSGRGRSSISEGECAQIGSRRAQKSRKLDAGCITSFGGWGHGSARYWALEEAAGGVVAGLSFAAGGAIGVVSVAGVGGVLDADGGVDDAALSFAGGMMFTMRDARPVRPAGSVMV